MHSDSVSCILYSEISVTVTLIAGQIFRFADMDVAK